MDNERMVKLWEMYKKGQSYQSQLNMQSKISSQVDFYEGRQWSDTKDSRDLPKPVVNIVKMIVRNKRAGVLSAQIKLAYQSSDNMASAERFTEFAEYVAKEIKQDDLDAVAVLDGAVKGTYIYHYYWDTEAKGMTGRIEGGLGGEVIDPLNVFFANPVEKDVQKQEWILIATRCPLTAVKEMAEEGVADMAAIVPDEKNNAYSEDTEPKEEEQCTVLTRYFRIDGEVHFEKAVQGTMLHNPRPLNPYLNESEIKSIEEEEDAAETALPDIDSVAAVSERIKASLYPLAIGSWDERNGCIYGISEVEGLIPNQKLINFLLGMYLLAVQNTSWGKYIVMKDALAKQRITNEPGQVLVDNSNTGNGIKRLQEPPLSPAPINLVNTIIEMTRSAAGATEVMTGEKITANMSGAAIAQLQAQAQKPIEEMRQRFWRVHEQIGKIYEQFFKLNYDNAEYTYQGNDKPEKAVFNSSEYLNTSFSCVVEAGAGSQFSDSLTIANLEMMLAKGLIDEKTFIKQYPATAMPNKSALLRAVEEREQGELKRASEMITALQQNLAEAQSYIEANRKHIDGAARMIAENERLKKELLEIYNTFNAIREEATYKLNAANMAITEQNSVIEQLYGNNEGGD